VGTVKVVDLRRNENRPHSTGEDDMIYVIATVEVKPGKREAFLAEFHKNVPNVVAEKGCIEYGPTVDVKTDIKTQIPLREDTVTIVEKWESLQALHAHSLAPHMATYRERVKDSVLSVSLQVLEPK
jgi:quinol monooxygenase YgiN